jgi:hypothetical protein
MAQTLERIQQAQALQPEVPSTLQAQLHELVRLLRGNDLE